MWDYGGTEGVEKDKPSKFYRNSRLPISQINMSILLTYFYATISSRSIKDYNVTSEAMTITGEKVFIAFIILVGRKSL